MMSHALYRVSEGVHCTHGYNRTGFLIIAYLVERDDWRYCACRSHSQAWPSTALSLCSLEAAVSAYSKVRAHHLGVALSLVIVALCPRADRRGSTRGII